MISPRLTACACALLCGLSAAVGGELKVDINRASKNLDSVTATGYAKWSANAAGAGTETTGAAAATQTFTSATGESITISFSQTPLSASRGGTGIVSNWYQAGAQSPDPGGARLVSDGITINPETFNGGGQIQMTITGLTAGHHTLLTYHNYWNAWNSAPTQVPGPMDIYLNGTIAVNGLQPTIRAVTDTVAPVAYLEFDVAGTGTVTTVLFAAQTATSASVTVKNPVINGFEIDTPNSTRIANTPIPADADEHVNADTGSAALGWSAALYGSPVSHDVYFGTDQAAVKNAARTSPEFKGNQPALSYAASGLSSALNYYWRIDEVDSQGNVTKGTVWRFRPRHLAFAGAEGYGRFARGGRGGVVVEVTNLNDSGPGSLRDALTGNYGPRTVVFTVGGLITLKSDITISQPYITLAGQTAPGKGICVRAYALGMSGGKDVIIRNIRSRPGNIAGITLNGSGMAGSDHCIMDHCSISWGIDEEMSTRSSKNITLQRTLISEALNIAGHQNYPAGTAHGYAASIGGNVGSFHHNLLAHNEGRNWSLAGGLDAAGSFAGLMDIFNNVVYNWGTRTTDGGAHQVNFVNNYYKPGASSTIFYALRAQYDNFPGTQQYYFSGNVMPGHFNESNQTAGRTAVNGTGTVPTSYSPWVNAPFFPSYATIQTAGAAYKAVLSDVGCTQPAIDDHDVRVIGETLAGTYTYTGMGPYGGSPGLPNSQNDVGGWENYPEAARPTWDSDHDGLPDWWETVIGTNLRSAAGDFSDANADPDNDGYTLLEDYLSWMAAPHVSCVVGGSIDVDLSKYTRGYTATPVRAVSGAVNGSVALLNDGKTARFTPAAGFAGLGSLTFTAMDSTGDSMSANVGVRVANAATFPTGAQISSGATRSILFTGQPGAVYRLQQSTDLLTWTDWTALTATGDLQTMDIPASLLTGDKRFFRGVQQ